MERIGVRELRQHASRYLSIVETGQIVEVTSRGKLVAELRPPDRAGKQRDELIAQGLIVPAAQRTGRVRASHPVTVPPGGPTNAELLDVERQDRM